MIEKFKALVQWFVRLERQEHQHWCTLKPVPWSPHGVNDSRCKHQSIAWRCNGVFCARIERKDCPDCVARRAKEPKCL
jgi:hypothetical protein